MSSRTKNTAGVGIVKPSALAPSGGWRSGAGQLAFWLIAAVGTIVLTVAWFWYGLSFSEEMTEQCKSAAANSSMAGFGLAFGGIPLVIIHVLTLVPMLVIGAMYYSKRTSGVVLAVVVVVAASGFGIIVNELLWGGQLFTMSAASSGCL
tara:strand:+ start:278 stop:724 length:447 start_codon:yes stop_codon:yes gene_type:complete